MILNSSMSISVISPYISVQFTFVWHQKKSLDGSRMIIDYCKLNQIVFLLIDTTLYMVSLLEQIHKASDTWYYDHQLNEHILFYGLPWWLRWWRICLQCGRPGFGPWVRKSPREGNGYPLQFSCLENPMDRGAWWATVQGVSKSQTWLRD